MKCDTCQAARDSRRLRSIDRGVTGLYAMLGALFCLSIVTAAAVFIVGVKVKAIDAAIVAEE